MVEIMEKLKFNQTIIKRRATDDLALQTVLKATCVSREYLINGYWTSNAPNAKPDGTRIVFENTDSFKLARDTYVAWLDITRMKTGSPEQPREIIKRLFLSRSTDKPIVLFVPWGVRPNGLPKPELLALSRIKFLQETLIKRHIATKVLLMPADIYATEINQLNEQQTKVYFDWVKQQAETRGFQVLSWSAIRSANRIQYDKLVKTFTKEKLQEIFSKGQLERIREAAERRSGYVNCEDIENAAYAYLRERVCEAEIIETVYRPIKVSMVAKEKDARVDRELPRIYIVPKEEQFPWLK